MFSKPWISKKRPVNLTKMESFVISGVFISITQFGVIEMFYTTKWCCSQDWSSKIRKRKTLYFSPLPTFVIFLTDL